MDNKICVKCKEEKCCLDFQRHRKIFKKYKNKEKEFYYYPICKECNKGNKSEQDERYRKTHKIEKAIMDKKYREDNKFFISQKKSKYYQEHKDIFIARSLKNDRLRRLNDASFRLKKCVSSSIRKCINKNNLSFTKFIPYTIQELKQHLESLFEPWMTWENQGIYKIDQWNDNNQSTWVWNIDHIIPQSKLPYSSMEDDNFKKCWALENLRPYSAKQNIIDGARNV